MKYEKAVKAIEKAGVLLVYPIKNEREPPSIWYALHPRTTMSWDWADTADNRVVDLWHLRTELSENHDVVYTKWFRGRATFYSRDVFKAMLCLLDSFTYDAALTQNPESYAETGELYRLLLDDSPLTPKTMRAALGLEGRIYESTFNRAQKELWQRLLIVGFGEVEEGSFPSLAVGATRHLFEDLWQEARKLDHATSLDIFEKHVPPGSTFHKQFLRLQKQITSPSRPKATKRKASRFKDLEEEIEDY